MRVSKAKAEQVTKVAKRSHRLVKEAKRQARKVRRHHDRAAAEGADVPPRVTRGWAD